MNIYVTSEPQSKLENVILNIKNFYIFDVQQFVAGFKLDTKKPSNIYLINNEIMAELNNISKLKKYQGIIYINKNLSENLYKSLYKVFNNNQFIDQLVLIDNVNVPKWKNLHSIFHEVLFYHRFRKMKIVESTLTTTKDTIARGKSSKI